MHEVEVAPVSLDALGRLLSSHRVEDLRRSAELARRLLDGRVVWNVNATAHGGGVAEMLQTLISYVRGVGVDGRWLVLDGDPAFFAVTKRVHNLVHGQPGDGGPLGDAERVTMEATLAANLEAMLPRVTAGDVVILHDPQPAGLVTGLREAGAVVVWRSHIGADTANEHTGAGLGVPAADGRRRRRVRLLPRGLRTGVGAAREAARHHPLRRPAQPEEQGPDARAEVERLLLDGGLLAGGRATPAVVDGLPLAADARLVVQVSRWDRLKDMAGVLTGFVAADAAPGRAPDARRSRRRGRADDPEGAEVLAECRALWRALPAAQRDARVTWSACRWTTRRRTR